MRTDWTALPQAVKKRITARVDGTGVTPASNGDHAEIAARVAGANGSVFYKVASSDLEVWLLCHERRASRPVTTPNSSATERDFETAGLLVVAFEHCSGPHATLLPGNPDLDPLRAVLAERAETPAPDASWFSPKSRLGCTHPAVDGDTLIDTDLTPANLSVTSASPHIVDAGYAVKASPWLEPALLIPCLIGRGHTLDKVELARRITDVAHLARAAGRCGDKVWARGARAPPPDNQRRQQTRLTSRRPVPAPANCSCGTATNAGSVPGRSWTAAAVPDLAKPRGYTGHQISGPSHSSTKAPDGSGRRRAQHRMSRRLNTVVLCPSLSSGDSRSWRRGQARRSP